MATRRLVLDRELARRAPALPSTSSVAVPTAAQRAVADPRTLGRADLLHLQRTAGNAATALAVQRKRSYASLDGQMRGNNDVRLLEQDEYHVSIVDPKQGGKRSLQFDEFHVTVENGTAERKAHFFYDEKGAYLKAKTESHPQTQAYVADAGQQGSGYSRGSEDGTNDTRLRPLSTLANMSSYAAKGFLNLLTNADQVTAGRTALQVTTTPKATTGEGLTLAQKMAAKTPYSKAEADGFAAFLRGRLGPEAGTVHAPVPVEGGNRIQVLVSLADPANDGEMLRKEIAGMAKIASVVWAPAPKP